MSPYITATPAPSRLDIMREIMHAIGLEQSPFNTTGIIRYRLKSTTP